MKKLQQGFTLVEIMIVVAIIGLLAAIAIPNFMKSRETTRMNACINNLRQIDSAKEQWAIQNNIAEGEEAVADTVGDEEGFTEYIKGKKMPTCPAGGAYTAGDIGDDPTCDYTTSDGKWKHELPES